MPLKSTNFLENTLFYQNSVKLGLHFNQDPQKTTLLLVVKLYLIPGLPRGQQFETILQNILHPGKQIHTFLHTYRNIKKYLGILECIKFLCMGRGIAKYIYVGKI